RTGIPITLSLVYLELARRIGLPMAGVGMPGHFLVRPTVDEMAIFVDAFHKGEILFEEDCRDRIQTLYGRGARLYPRHLDAIGPRPFLARILMNLKVIYLQQQDIPRAFAAIDRILLLMPESLLERRDRGLIHYRQGQLDAAREDLKYYLLNHPDAQDSFEIQQVVSQINQTLQE
ncbi:MAG: tetratricopeptide repeat protein, partial [Leptolyngbya sp. SIO1D8]|nr:tetratricopeptide repeat protein [Leptolyngbya sp. SIO1D8]